MNAHEFGLGFPVLPVDMSATGTLSGGMSGIDNTEQNSKKLRLVPDKEPKLSEGPFSKLIPLAGPNRCPVTDARKIFEGDSLPGAFGLQNKFFGNDVVGITFETVFSSGYFLEAAFGVFCSFHLKALLVGRSLLPDLFDGFPGKHLSGRIRRKIFDPKINTKKSLDIFDGFFRNFDCLEKEKLSFLRDQIRFALDIWNPVRAVANKRNRLPPSDCPQGHALFFVRENPGVIGQGSHGKEGSFDVLSNLVGVRYFGNTPNNHLGRQGRRFSYSVIDTFMELELIEGLTLPRDVRNFVAGGVGFLEGFKEHFCLFFGREEFDHEGKLHG